MQTVTSETDSSKAQPEWAELRGKIKARFGKIADVDIEAVNGDLDLLASEIQSAYGYPKEEADKQFANFKSSLNSGRATAGPAPVRTPEIAEPAETPKVMPPQAMGLV